MLVGGIDVVWVRGKYLVIFNGDICDFDLVYVLWEVLKMLKIYKLINFVKI